MEEKIKEVASYIANNVDEIINNVDLKGYENIEEVPSITDFREYIYEEEYIANATINIFDVKGSTHPRYVGYKWKELLKIGIRMHLNLPLLEKNPFYYLNEDPKLPTMYYSMFNNELYLTGDGNHRTAIAKVFFHHLGTADLTGVNLTKYKIDFNLKKKIDEVKNLALQKGIALNVRIDRKKISREDATGWHKDRYQLKIYVNNKEINSKEISLLIEDLKKYNWFYKMFPSFLKSSVWK